jgi:hypothetical protein
MVEEAGVPGEDHEQATGKHYHLRLWVECTLFCNLQRRARTHVVLKRMYQACEWLCVRYILRCTKHVSGYSWNIAENGVKHQKWNQIKSILCLFVLSLLVILLQLLITTTLSSNSFYVVFKCIRPFLIFG